MLREEVSEHAEPSRPPRKTTPWVLIVVVVLTGLGLAHVAGLTKPLTTKALQWSQGGSGNPQTPARRPTGDEQSEDDLMFRHIMQMMPRDPNQGTAPTKPLMTKAPPSRPDGSRNLQTPAGRPAGGEVNNDNLKFQGVLQMTSKDLNHRTASTRPSPTKAQPPRQDGSRNLRTPASRLIGDWESDDDPMFPHVCHPVLKDPDIGTGLYMAGASGSMQMVIYKIVSEDRSGTNLVMGEYLIRTDVNYQVTYSVAKDGQSMTREYDGPNGHVSSHYRYLGPPTKVLSQCPPE